MTLRVKKRRWWEKKTCDREKRVSILGTETGGDMDVSKIRSNRNPELEALTEAEKGTADSGSELLVEVANLTGLPVDWVQTELTQIVKSSGHTPEQLTLDELRASMLEYLEEMNRELMEQEAADLQMLESMAIPSDLSH
jgi:hypothetical protein